MARQAALTTKNNIRHSLVLLTYVEMSTYQRYWLHHAIPLPGEQKPILSTIGMPAKRVLRYLKREPRNQYIRRNLETGESNRIMYPMGILACELC